MAELGTDAPICDCMLLEWGSETPAAVYAYWVSPEQSKDPGPAAPQT